MKPIYLLLLIVSFLTCGEKENYKIEPKTFEEKLSDAAVSIVDASIDYDPAYFSIKYPKSVYRLVVFPINLKNEIIPLLVKG